MEPWDRGAGGHVLWFGEGRLGAMAPNILEWYGVMPIQYKNVYNTRSYGIPQRRNQEDFGE